MTPVLHLALDGDLAKAQDSLMEAQKRLVDLAGRTAAWYSLTVLLVFFSPVVSGKGTTPVTGASLSLFPASVDFSWFPLENPGIVSIPLGFFFGWLGTVTSKERSSEAKYAEMEVRSLTGAGTATLM